MGWILINQIELICLWLHIDVNNWFKKPTKKNCEIAVVEWKHIKLWFCEVAYGLPPLNEWNAGAFVLDLLNYYTYYILNK